MTGKILGFDIQTRTGVISGEDGNRYSFITAEIKNLKSDPKPGMDVDFTTDEHGNALDVYVVISNAQVEMQSTNQTQSLMGICNTMSFKELFSYHGCYSRSQYWKVVIGIAFYTMILGLIAKLTYTPSIHSGLALVDGAVNSIERAAHTWSVMFFGGMPAWWIALMTSIKRFHDVNKSGMWVLLNIVPFLGNLIVIIMNGFFPSEHQNNRYCIKSHSVNQTKQTSTDTRQEPMMAHTENREPVAWIKAARVVKKVKSTMRPFMSSDFLKKYKFRIAAALVLLILPVIYTQINFSTQHTMSKDEARKNDFCYDTPVPKFEYMDDLYKLTNGEDTLHIQVKNGKFYEGLYYLSENHLVEFKEGSSLTLHLFHDNGRIACKLELDLINVNDNTIEIATQQVPFFDENGKQVDTVTYKKEEPSKLGFGEIHKAPNVGKMNVQKKYNFSATSIDTDKIFTFLYDNGQVAAVIYIDSLGQIRSDYTDYYKRDGSLIGNFTFYMDDEGFITAQKCTTENLQCEAKTIDNRCVYYRLEDPDYQNETVKTEYNEEIHKWYRNGFEYCGQTEDRY